MKKPRRPVMLSLALATLLVAGAGAAHATGVICLNPIDILAITTPQSYGICQGKTRLIRFTVTADAGYNGRSTFSTSSCALNIATQPIQFTNGVAEITTDATGSISLAPGTYNCTVSAATPSPSTMPLGNGCVETFNGNTVTFSYTLKRAGTCN